MKQTDILGQLREKREFIKPSKKRYEELKKVKSLTSKNDIRNIAREKKQVWVAIIDGQAQ